MHQAEELEALTARLIALERVWNDALEGSSSDAVPSIRRIARSLERGLDAYGDPELVSTVRKVQTAEPEELERLIPRLLQRARATVDKLPQARIEILVVEDDPELREGIVEALEAQNRKLRPVSSGGEAEAALDEGRVDLIVLDVDGSEVDGRDFLLTLRSRPATAGTPVVILSDRRDPAFRAECIALGADEFLEKPVEAEFFSAIVSARLGRTAALTRLAQEDHLTGLPNRAAFARIFRQLQAISERRDEDLTLAVVDVDNLKDVNDQLGHSAGDRALKGLATAARETLRDADVLARWGGDEFVILLPSTGVDGAVEAVEKARGAFLDWIVESGPGEEFELSFSAGVTAVGIDDALEAAVARADRLLYQAKKVGGDQIVGDGGLEGVPTPTVLLVEDEESVAGLLGRMLEMEGFVVRRAADGEEALEKVLGSPPDLVVLDIMLPGRDGFEVLQEMRSHEELQDLPVLILTALSEEDSVVKGFRLGVDEYLSKPVSREDFLARVRALARID